MSRKLEFETFWSIEKINMLGDTPLPYFFEPSGEKQVKVIVPDHVTYWDTLKLVGKKTKITIEILD